MTDTASESTVVAGPYSIGSTLLPGVSKLLEEAGEMVQVLGKLIATNGEAQHWEGSDLDRRLEEEVADVLAAVNFVMEANAHRLSWPAVASRTHSKRELFWRWHNEQMEARLLGTAAVPEPGFGAGLPSGRWGIKEP